MIKLIVTASGYVESNQMARIFWRPNAWTTPEIESGGLEPDNAFKCLVNELCDMYRRDYLWVDPDIHFDCKTNTLAHDLSYIYCPKCGKPLHRPFVPENFRQFIRNLCKATGAEEMAIDELPPLVAMGYV